MNNTVRFVAIIGFLTATVGFNNSSNVVAQQNYGGNPYLGGVDVRIQVPGERDRYDSGSGSAQFIKTNDGKSRLVVSGSIRKDSDTGFVMDGSLSKSGWSSRNGNLTIDTSGKITGSSIQQPYRIRISGFASGEKFNLKVEQELLEASKNKRGFPAGTKFLFSYALSRQANQQASGKVKSGQKVAGECKRIVWQSRNIANLGGGPMIMTQVPVCIKR
jgi:hypothetical protein